MGRNGKQQDAISGKNDEMRLQNRAAETVYFISFTEKIYLGSAL